MNDDVGVQNAYSHFCKRVSDTERSNRPMQVTKASPSLREAPHLNAVCLLVEQTLGCCGRERKRQTVSAREFSESRARGYTNMQQAYQSAALIFKLQVQEPTAKSIMQCNRCIGWHQHLCRAARLSRLTC